MNDSHTTKNYFAHGGEELVIGGKITFLPGATVEGGEGLFDLPTGGTGSAQVPYVPDSKATSASALREDLNKAPGRSSYRRHSRHRGNKSR